MTLPRIFVAGHNGMVGSAIVRRLSPTPCEIITRTRNELDLTDSQAVRGFFKTEKIDQVFLAAAKVGGIYANSAYPADFIADNLAIELNIIQSAFRANIQNLIFLGSSCIYPKHSAQPMSEDALLSGPLEPTNEPYAIAKIAGIKLCESFNRQHGTDYRALMPTNLYGPHDNFHPENSHVIPALMQRIHRAKHARASDVTIWGTGKPMREFLHVDDLAQACLYVANLEQSAFKAALTAGTCHINVGTGQDISIQNLAELLCDIIGFDGALNFDPSREDGAPRKLLDVSRLTNLGWTHETSLKSGLKQTYAWYKENT